MKSKARTTKGTLQLRAGKEQEHSGKQFEIG